MKNATTTTTALSQNGTRQPHENLISSGRATTGMKMRAARICPPWVPVSVHDVKNERRESGACSRVSDDAPACSPAAESPCARRHSTSRAGANQPICAKPGRQPMTKVESPISSRVNISTFCRPMRSPKWPRMTAPKGRAIYANPKVANDITRAAWSPDGKNTVGKMRAAAEPNRKKS